MLMLTDIIRYFLLVFAWIAKAGHWIMDQMVAAGRNFVRLFTGTSLGDVAPPSVVSTVDWFLKQFPRAIGLGTPQQQITASIVMGIATFFTGAVTGGAAWAIIGLWVLTLVIGLLRLIPAADRAASGVRNPARKAWDWLVNVFVRW